MRVSKDDAIEENFKGLVQFYAGVITLLKRTKGQTGEKFVWERIGAMRRLCGSQQLYRIISIYQQSRGEQMTELKMHVGRN